MKKIELGDTVKCKITGFKGVAVARTMFINGCVQIGVQPKMKEKDKYPDEVGIDIDSLEIVKKEPKPKQKQDTGGRPRPVPKMRGY